MLKIVTILGARPQFIKAAVLSRIISENKEVEEVIVHTGQHFDANMSAIFFDQMNIPKPKYNLDINNLSHGVMTGIMLQKLDKILESENPEVVVVYGDTNSTLAGALVAKKQHKKLVHIEAGLRSYNMQMPEEINRIVTDRIADLLCCPTANAIENLKQEGFDNFNAKIFLSGDIMKDAVEYYSGISEKISSIIQEKSLTKDEFVLATVHRQENTQSIKNLTSIFKALEQINDDCNVIMPLHPRTKKVLQDNNLTFNIIFIEPVSYFDMLALLKNCKMVITDSGGLQKEAFFNHKPCVILREETEWVELLEHKFARLAGSDAADIVFAYRYFKNSVANFSLELYGNNVGEKIYTELINLIKK